MTPRTTSPCLIADPGIARFTVATITSPTRPYRCLDWPRTWMAPTIFAPVLSATSRMDLIWIMVSTLLLGGGGRGGFGGSGHGRFEGALLEDGDEAPAFRLGHRARLRDL